MADDAKVVLPESVELALNDRAHDCNATSAAGDELIGLDDLRRAIAAAIEEAHLEGHRCHGDCNDTGESA